MGVTITPNNLLPNNIPSIEWLFGPNNDSLPLGVIATVTPTNLGDDSTYTSTLQFSPLNQSYAGNYTCRLGGNPRLAARVKLIVNGIP